MNQSIITIHPSVHPSNHQPTYLPTNQPTYLPTYLIHSLHKECFMTSYSYSVSEQIIHILWNTEDLLWHSQQPAFVPILSQTNQFETLHTVPFKMHFNIILSLMLMPSKCYHSFMYPHQNHVSSPP